jgi:regulator of protease activity HflC (stomatin/prohibitin superfamily)
MSTDDLDEMLSSRNRGNPTVRSRDPLVTLFKVFVAIVLLFFASLLFWTLFVVSVPAGSIGVQDTFGSVSDETLQPGIHFKGPFTRVVEMSTRTSKYIDYGTNDKVSIVALSHDGLSTTMDIAVNFHINPGKAVELYKNVGPEYMNLVMVNPIHSVPRDLISKYDTKTLYSASQEGSTDRAKLEQELFDGIANRLNLIGVRDSIVIEQVSIRNIDFPQAYKDTITARMNMDTEIATKRSELERQRIEAERVVVIAEADAAANVARAKGEAEANRIRTESLSDILLKYTWIQGMKDNPKAIYIPTGQDGIPLFKNVDSTT